MLNWKIFQLQTLRSRANRPSKARGENSLSITAKLCVGADASGDGSRVQTASQFISVHQRSDFNARGKAV